ncbi:putative Oxidoreductase, FAD-binding protein [unidentified eubacterium SCB49]|nr:putative Oxidoreductase, FAD-binding protein [unidentified eubacterium SCB49]
MIGSLWRYSHFLLALISALFLVVAAVTGTILAVEPVSLAAQPYHVTALDNVPLSQTVIALKEQYSEVLDLEVTPEHFVKASVFTEEGDSETIFIHPTTAQKLGEVTGQSPFFSFVTNVHRSLFLKSIGRAFVGIASFLLCFIAVTGVFLLAQRQGGFKNWFVKVRESDFGQRYHVILGRWFLVPLVVVAATGVFLSAEKFSLLPEPTTTQGLVEPASEIGNEKPIDSSLLFQNITLDEVRKVSFPFSDDPEDYYQLELRESELLIQQHTGQVMSEVPYPFVKVASLWSTKWHTGQGNVLWSIILLLASLSLLFFIFSGFYMSIKKRKKAASLIQKCTKDEAEYIVLVGSESGNTHVVAKAFSEALIDEGKKVFLSTLNEYSTYANASHLIVFTATYGDGDAPTNARKFEGLLKSIVPINNLKFAVVGFGSITYPRYCLYAVKVDALLHAHNGFTPILPIVKINNQSDVAFYDWLKKWNESAGLSLKVTLPVKDKKNLKEYSFEVIERTDLNIDNTFILKLKVLDKLSFSSGDLLAVIPPNSDTARKYSIAKVDGAILLSVKKHNKGLCSEYFSLLKSGDTILASIEKNESFHLPEDAPSVYAIANGTGIAPFLGMLSQNKEQPFHLLWGARGEDSFTLYKSYLDKKLRLANVKSITEPVKTFEIAFSQKRNKNYVQDLLLKDRERVARKLNDGCVFMICGSMVMQQAVLEVLEEITKTELQQPLSHFESKGQLLMDCY